MERQPLKVSIVIPVKNGADTLEECLEGIFAQKHDFDLEVLLIDSGSSDRTLEIAAGFPVRVIHIPPGEFNHGDTRNLGVAETDGDLVIFFVQDAYPSDLSWLEKLTRNLVEDPKVAGAFSRVIPRPDCGPLVEKGVRGDLNFGEERLELRMDEEGAPDNLDPTQQRIRSNYNDVASVLRRSVWKRLPYPRTPFGEDILWSNCVQREGYTVVFEALSEVVHSHEYQPSSIYYRTHIDGWFNKAYFNRYCIAKLSHVFIMTWRLFREDLRFLKTKSLPLTRRWKESIVSLLYHFMETLGFYMGAHANGEALRGLSELEDDFLRIVMVMSDSTASDSNGGRAEVEGLARELIDMGHEVTLILQDPETDPSTPVHEEIDGIPSIRVNSEHPLSEMFHEPGDAGLHRFFEKIIEEKRPHVIHCQDVSAFSLYALQQAAKQRVASIVTINDFWFRCPRTDLVKPDQTPCVTPYPLRTGCEFCLRNKPEFIFPARFFDKWAGERAGARCWELCANQEDRTMAGRIFRRLAGPVARRRAGRLLQRPRLIREALEATNYIAVPDFFTRDKCLEAGLDQGKVAVIRGRHGSSAMKRFAKIQERAGAREKLWSERDANPHYAKQVLIKYRQAAGQTLFQKRAAGL